MNKAAIYPISKFGEFGNIQSTLVIRSIAAIEHEGIKIAPETFFIDRNYIWSKLSPHAWALTQSWRHNWYLFEQHPWSLPRE